MDDFQVPTALKILFGIAAAIAAALLLRLFLPISRKASHILAAIGAACVPVSFYVMPNTSELIASFAAAVVFGCLGVCCYTSLSKYFAETFGEMAPVRKILVPAGGVLLLSALIAFFGGLLTAAPISSISYMLEINIFRGVKVSQLFPVAFFIIAYLACFGYGGRPKTENRLQWRDIRDLLHMDIKAWMLLIAAGAGGVGAYYILRTGHELDLVSGYEMLFRNELENMLLARPRTKEFLFGFPAIMLMVYAAVRRLKLWTILFGLCGAIGVTSVINTFAHIRTPLYIGIYRTCYSLAFAIVVGTAAILIFEGLHRFYGRHLKRYFASGGAGGDG